MEYPLMVLLCSCTVMPFVSALDLRQSAGMVLTVCSCCLAVWSIAFYGRRTMLISAILLAVAAVSVAIFSFSGGDAAIDMRYSLRTFLDWAISYLSGFRSEVPVYKSYLVILFSIAVTLFAGYFTVRNFSLLAAVSPGIACFAALFIIGHPVNITSLWGFLLAGILYALLSFYKRNAGILPSGKTPQPALFMLSALPLAALALTASVVLSSSVMINPAWMQGVRDVLLKKDVTQPGNTGNYIAPNIKNTNELGGNLKLDDTILMEVDSPVNGIYLRGVSKDVYTGHSWERSDSGLMDFPSEYFADELELVKGYEILTGIPPENSLFPAFDISITYENLHTDVLYVPLKTTGVSADVEMKTLGEDSLLSNQRVGSGFRYTAAFLMPAYENQSFQEIARSSHAGLYKTNQSIVNSDLAAKAEGIRQRFLQLPPSIPERVRTLAHELTSALSNDFDKAKAIEKYLAGNYTYTLTPGSFDRSRDFVDDFLFENKQGYCTYYATAMSVLLRCAGIPSRYVEGYVLPAKQPNSSVYKVTRKQGHAWAEAYFEGLGWIPFEATSAYAGGARPDNTPEPTAMASPTPRPTSPTTQDTPKPDDWPASSPTQPKPSPLPLLLPLGMLLLLAMAAAVPIRAGNALQRLSPREAVLLLFGHCLKLLEKQGLKLDNGETMPHFSQRADKHFGGSIRGFAKTAELFQLARYSNHEITPDQKNHMAEFRKKLLRGSLRKLGLLRYLYFKWIWGIGNTGKKK